MHRSTFLSAARHLKCKVLFSSCSHNVPTTTATSSASDEQRYADARPFAEMPGPRGPLGLGSIWNYTPWFGPYSWERLHRAGHAKYTAYGPCVRETMVPGVHVVWLFDPRDIAAVFADGDAPTGRGHYPQRTSHLALQRYRCDRPHVYRTGGLLPTNGPEWWRLRQELQRGLSSPQHVRGLLAATERITREWIDDVLPATTDRAEVIVDDVMPELSRLNLELVGHLAFDVRLNAFAADERRADSLTTRLIAAAETTNSCVLPTDQGAQLWRWFRTPTYRRLCGAQQFMESVAVDLVARKRRQIAAGEPRSASLLEEYLGNPRLDRRDVVGMAADVLLAGVDTTTYATCFLLYHIARNAGVQRRLHAEARTLLPSSDASCSSRLSDDALATGATYARAVLKETLRLNPISVGVGRCLNGDLVLGGYQVPRGTVAVTQNLVACRLAQNFPEADAFRPERWLRNGAGRRADAVHPYLVLPFGHGMRACIARRMAEQSMLVLVLNVVRHFELTWCGATEHLDIVTHLINKPDQPVRIGFKRRRC